MPNITNYKGRPVLVLNPTSNYPTQFGKLKADAILDKIPEIRKFVKDQDTDFLDITPPVNNYGKKFEITLQQAELILDCLQDIIDFTKITEINDHQRHLKNR